MSEKEDKQHEPKLKLTFLVPESDPAAVRPDAVCLEPPDALPTSQPRPRRRSVPDAVA